MGISLTRQNVDATINPKGIPMAPEASGPPMSAPVDASSRGSVRLPCALRAAVGGSRWGHRGMLGTASERQSHRDLGGIPLRYPKALSSTGVSRVFDITVRQTGKNEDQTPRS